MINLKTKNGFHVLPGSPLPSVTLRAQFSASQGWPMSRKWLRHHTMGLLHRHLHCSYGRGSRLFASLLLPCSPVCLAGPGLPSVSPSSPAPSSLVEHWASSSSFHGRPTWECSPPKAPSFPIPTSFISPPSPLHPSFSEAPRRSTSSCGRCSTRRVTRRPRSLWCASPRSNRQ